MVFIISAIIVLIILLMLYMLKEAFTNRIIRHECSFSDFPSSFGEVKVFFISDIHKRKIHDAILADVSAEKPDIIIIGGDLVEKNVPFERVRSNVTKLRDIAPVYFVWGNNDYEVDYHELDALLLECKVKVLDNTAVLFESAAGDKLYLLGVDDIGAKRDNLDLALQDADNDGFKILACHNPQIIDQIKDEQKISFIVSGHTHGGQIRIFGFGPYEKGGLKKAGNTDILISNGYGTTAVPLRLGARAETHMIILKNKQLSAR